MSRKTDKNGYNRRSDGTFGKNNCANPNGRPEFSLISILKEELQKIPKGKKETRARLLINKILDSAINGNDQQIKNILQYVEGMPKQNIDIDDTEDEITDEEVEKAIQNAIKYK